MMPEGKLIMSSTQIRTGTPNIFQPLATGTVSKGSRVPLIVTVSGVANFNQYPARYWSGSCAVYDPSYVKALEIASGKSTCTLAFGTISGREIRFQPSDTGMRIVPGVVVPCVELGE